jgi:hypothetical protein
VPLRTIVEDGIFVIRMSGVLKLDEIPKLTIDASSYYERADCRFLVLVDNTELKVIAPDAADALVEIMRNVNPRVLRSAFVMGDGTAALQLSRMIRTAPSQKRRTFTNVDQALAWLLSP